MTDPISCRDRKLTINYYTLIYIQQIIGSYDDIAAKAFKSHKREVNSRVALKTKVLLWS